MVLEDLIERLKAGDLGVRRDRASERRVNREAAEAQSKDRGREAEVSRPRQSEPRRAGETADEQDPVAARRPH